MIKNFWNSLSTIEKDNVYNICFSIVFGWIMAYAYDKGFLICILFIYIIYICMYIISTISYFRKYLTDERRYTINIDNGIQEVILNLYNPQWDKTHSWSFTSNQSEDGKLKDSTDWV